MNRFELMPMLRCRTCIGDRPVRTLPDGTHVCAACRQPYTPLSPIEQYLSRNVTAAVIEATRAPDPTGDTGLTPHHNTREATGMSEPYEEPVNWRNLHRGDVIVTDPEHHVPGEWPFIAAIYTGGMVHIHAGSVVEHTFHVYPDEPITVRHTDVPSGGVS